MPIAPPAVDHRSGLKLSMATRSTCHLYDGLDLRRRLLFWAFTTVATIPPRRPRGGRVTAELNAVDLQTRRPMASARLTPGCVSQTPARHVAWMTSDADLVDGWPHSRWIAAPALMVAHNEKPRDVSR